MLLLVLEEATAAVPPAMAREAPAAAIQKFLKLLAVLSWCVLLLLLAIEERHRIVAGLDEAVDDVALSFRERRRIAEDPRITILSMCGSDICMEPDAFSFDSAKESRISSLLINQADEMKFEIGTNLFLV